MSDISRTPLSVLREGARSGLVTSLRKLYANLPIEPLPMVQIDLLLALRRRERQLSEQPIS